MAVEARHCSSSSSAFKLSGSIHQQCNSKPEVGRSVSSTRLIPFHRFYSSYPRFATMEVLPEL
eukprot:922460-Amphidinium_carterae.1